MKLFKHPLAEKHTPSREDSLLPQATEQIVIPFEKTAETLARELQLLTDKETYPLVIGPWARADRPLL